MLGVTRRHFTSGRGQAQIRVKPASSLLVFFTILAALTFPVQEADARGLGAIRHLVELAARSGEEASKAAKLSPDAARFQSEVDQVRRIIEGRPDVDVIFQDADGEVRVLRQNADENEKLNLSDNGFVDSRRDIFVTYAALIDRRRVVFITDNATSKAIFKDAFGRLSITASISWRRRQGILSR